MSKADTPLNRKTFRAVLEVVTYIPTKSDSDIAKGMNQAIEITIRGRLLVVEVMYLKG